MPPRPSSRTTRKSPSPGGASASPRRRLGSGRSPSRPAPTPRRARGDGQRLGGGLHQVEAPSGRRGAARRSPDAGGPSPRDRPAGRPRPRRGRRRAPRPARLRARSVLAGGPGPVDRGPAVRDHERSSRVPLSRSSARVQSMRTAPGGSAHPGGDLVEAEPLQVAQDDHLAIIGRQGGQGVGQEHGLLALRRRGAGRGGRRRQRLLHPRADRSRAASSDSCRR